MTFCSIQPGVKSDDLTYVAHLKLPGGWKFGTALPDAHAQGDGIQFGPVSLTTLVDSPVLAGAYFRSIPLATDVQPTHHLDLAGDSAASIEIPADELEAYSRLVREAGALFGARHYDHYDFLLSLSDHFFPNGLEHHQSSDNRAPERMLLDPDMRESFADLLPHEFAHSWNGKFRRPAGLATPDFGVPMKGDLLWAYEGLTQYIGELLSARAGVYAGSRRSISRSVGCDGRISRSSSRTELASTSRHGNRRADTLFNYRQGVVFGIAAAVDFYDEELKLIWLGSRHRDSQTVRWKKIAG